MEFEKVFPSEYKVGSKLLTVMDGVMKNEYRKMFLLTTNDLSVEPNLLQRPGRIRYMKTFGNLNKEVVTEIVDDQLRNKEIRDELIEFISFLELITVDIVTALISECNIHNVTPRVFEDFFNIKKLSDVFDVYEVTKEGDKMFSLGAKIYPGIITEGYEGYTFKVDKKTIGDIETVNNNGTFEVEIYQEDNADGSEAESIFKTFKLMPSWSKNRSFLAM